MFGASKAWFGSKSLWKPKNIHSFDYLKYLYGVLSKNAVVTEQNQQLLIEVWRIISEILIWGDQNDSKVFDFFLEKNMLTFYIAYIHQPSARFIIVQLLQTLNIMFENTKQETSIYFLLSNNHVNEIITSQFDFADEEVMAYYISFMKTLSLKLNAHTIHFFFNEHTRNFPLLTEALKFDSHPESMVRIAARTITLNVFSVRNRAVIRFVCDRVAPAQFSYYAYHVSRQAVAMDACLSLTQALQLQQGASPAVVLPSPLTGQQSISSLARARERLHDYAAEHLDQLHYAADVLQLEIEELNAVISPILLSRILLPVYLPSLLPSSTSLDVDQLVENMPRISRLLSLYLLSHFFVVFKGHAPLLCKLLNVLANGDASTNANIIRQLGKLSASEPQSLIDALGRSSVSPSFPNTTSPEANSTNEAVENDQTAETSAQRQELPRPDSSLDVSAATNEIFVSMGTNQTDDEKLSEFTQSFGGRVYLSAIMHVLDAMDSNASSENAPFDRETVFALTLLLSIVNNSAIPPDALSSVGLNSKMAPVKSEYNHFLVDKLVTILSSAAMPDTKLRPVTVTLAAELLKSQVLIYPTTGAAMSDSVFTPSPPPSSPIRASSLTDHDLARIESAREESTLVLRSFFKSEDTFVDAFEDEYNHFHDRRRVDIERVLGDTNLLLSPAVSTPLSGVDFAHRLPCGEAEHARFAMRVFFTLRALSLQLRHEPETQLPLLRLDNLVHPGDALDLNNSDLLACSVTVSNDKTERLFLVLERDQLILVRPDALRMGWGIVRLAGPLYDVELTVDKDDGRGLHVTLHPVIISRSSVSHLKSGTLTRESSSLSSLGSADMAYSRALVSARFQFDDHIRCRAARERIIRGRQRVRVAKLQRVAALLEIPPEATNYGTPGPAGGNSPVNIATTSVNQAVLSMFNPKIQQAIMAASASTPLASRAPFLPNSLSTPLFQNDSLILSASKMQGSSSLDHHHQQPSAGSGNSSILTTAGGDIVPTSKSGAAIGSTSTDSQLNFSSSSSSTGDIPGVLNAGEHRRRFMQTLGVVSPLAGSSSSSAVPPIPPRLHEYKQKQLSDQISDAATWAKTSGEENGKQQEKPQSSSLLIVFDEPKVEEEEEGEKKPSSVVAETENDQNRLVKSESRGIFTSHDKDTTDSDTDDSLILKRAIEDLAADPTAPVIPKLDSVELNNCTTTEGGGSSGSTVVASTSSEDQPQAQPQPLQSADDMV